MIQPPPEPEVVIGGQRLTAQEAGLVRRAVRRFKKDFGDQAGIERVLELLTADIWRVHLQAGGTHKALCGVDPDAGATCHVFIPAPALDDAEAKIGLCVKCDRIGQGGAR